MMREDGSHPVMTPVLGQPAASSPCQCLENIPLEIDPVFSMSDRVYCCLVYLVTQTEGGLQTHWRDRFRASERRTCCLQVLPKRSGVHQAVSSRRPFLQAGHSRRLRDKRIPSPVRKMQETQVQSLSREDPLEEEMPAVASLLAWRIPWREEPGGLQSTGSQSRT